MPDKFNEPRRRKIPRALYCVQHWFPYDRVLQQRGSLAVWVTPEALEAWHATCRDAWLGSSPSYRSASTIGIVHQSRPMRVTSGKNLVQECHLHGSVRAEPNGRATRPRPPMRSD